MHFLICLLDLLFSLLETDHKYFNILIMLNSGEHVLYFVAHTVARQTIDQRQFQSRPNRHRNKLYVTETGKFYILLFGELYFMLTATRCKEKSQI